LEFRRAFSVKRRAALTANGMAQYQQNPTSEISAIVKREWWQIWEGEEPPDCQFTLMAWDTAFEKSSRADYSAMYAMGCVSTTRTIME
jgi:phage terminase large subunit-like protein